MIELRSLLAPDGLLLWGRLIGTWGREECAALLAFFAELTLPRGCRVVLDFTALGHLHFEGVPQLIAVADRLDGRGTRLEVAGLSDQLRDILELGGAREARDFIERHGLRRSPLPSPADRVERAEPWTGAFDSDPHGWSVVSLN
jgi:hypothetical protein